MREIKTSWSIRYHLEGDEEERHVKVDEEGLARPAELARELGLSIKRSSDYDYVTRRATITPKAPLVVTSLSVAILELEVRGASSIFLSGYNSWTDSVERHPLSRIRGLRGVPTALVNRWVLDNSGDYRFVEQSGLPGNLHGVGYGYLRYGDRVLLAGSLDEDPGYTVVRESARGNALKLEKEPPARVIGAGEEVELISFAVCEGTLTQAFGRYVELMGVTRRPAPALAGYSSWYRHYGDIDQEKLICDLHATAELYGGRELGPVQAVFQVDDGYALVGDWTMPDKERFPDGMAFLAEKARACGLVPGLWLAPFLVEKRSSVAFEHPEWLLRNAEGELVSAAGNWSGAWALDTQNPEVREHIRSFMGTVTREWGYQLLKLDFLFGACLEPHIGLNRGQLMAAALDLLRDSVPEGTWFDLCGVPIMSAFGRTEYCRVGCDVGLDWDDVPYMRLLHRERVSTRRSLANTGGRAHLDGVVFRNDPDVFFLRSDVKLTDAQRIKLLNSDAALGGMFLTSDNVAQWGDAQRATFERAFMLFVRKECAK
ncbi:MAG: alpha-galactosidase [Atopobiaceae bacterium]|nr:alpha-galactosidase [Atopobiaceae bacterium]